MKIHLPSRLRKALLACLAALAVPAALPSTIGSASGIAAVWLISSQAAQAAVSKPSAWQDESVGASVEKELKAADFADKTKGLRKYDSGTLKVTESLEAAGLSVEAGELHIADNVTLTVGTLGISESTVKGLGAKSTLKFGGADAKDFTENSKLTVENLVFAGSNWNWDGKTPRPDSTGADNATVGGSVDASSIEVTWSEDRLTVTNFTGTDLTKTGAGTLAIGDATVANEVQGNYTLGAGTLEFVGTEVTFDYSNFTWKGDGKTDVTLKLSGSESSTLNVGSDITLASHQRLEMGDNATITGGVSVEAQGSHLKMGKDSKIEGNLTMDMGTVEWTGNLTVDALQGAVEKRTLDIDDGNILTLGGGTSDYKGDITGDGELKVGAVDEDGVVAGGAHTLTGKVNVGGLVVDAGELTLSGEVKATNTWVKGGTLTLEKTENTTKDLGVLIVMGDGNMVVNDDITVSYFSHTRGEISGTGTLSFDQETSAGTNGKMSITGLKYTGTGAAALSGEVSSTVIEVENAAATLNVHDFVKGGDLKKLGAGTLVLSNKDDKFEWTGEEGDVLKLEQGTLELKGGRVDLTADFGNEKGNGNIWASGTTLYVNGSVSSTLRGNVTLSEGQKLQMGHNATIDGDVVLGDWMLKGGELEWKDTLKVKSLSSAARNVENVNPLRLHNRTLTLGDGTSDFLGDIVGQAGAHLVVEGGSHTFSGQIGRSSSDVNKGFALDLKGGTFTIADSEDFVNLGDVTFKGEDASLVVDRVKGDVEAAKLRGEGGTVSGGGTLRLSEDGSDFDGAVGTAESHLHELVLEQGEHHFGSAAVDDLVLGKESTSFQGGITEGGQSASLLVDGELTLGGSLTLTLGKQKGVNSPYVQADSVKLGGENGKLQLELQSAYYGASSVLGFGHAKDFLGNYYLVTGLEEGTTLDQFELVNRQQMEAFLGLLNYYEDSIDNKDEAFEYSLELKIEEGSLVLSFSQRNHKWVWKAQDKQGKFTNDWSSEDSGWGAGMHTPSSGPEHVGVHFDGSELEGGDVVNVKGEVHPATVEVTDGKYVFQGDGSIVLDDPKNAGIYEQAHPGLFEVKDAWVDMKVGTNIYELKLSGSSVFIVDHATAIQDDTKVTIDGSDVVLAFGEDETGSIYAKDLDSKALARNIELVGDTDVLNIQVGKTYEEFAKAGGQPGGTKGDLTIGSADSIYGSHALRKGGIDKTGRLGLTLEWSTSDPSVVETYTGSVTVEEGSLTLRTHGGDLKLDGQVTVHKGGELKLLGDKGQTVEVTKGFRTGDLAKGGADVLSLEDQVARVVLGTVGDGSIYKVSGSNLSFDGEIELVGDGKADVAVFSAAMSAGGTNTTLVLSGRALTFESGHQYGDDPIGVAVNAGNIVVTDATFNMVGGYTMKGVVTDPNTHITFTGTVTGGGTLANAQLDHHHVLEGDISGFTGTIVAGYVQAGETEITDDAELGERTRSSWTLKLGTNVAELGNHLAGTGVIEVEKAGDTGLVLSGVIGDKDLGNTVDLKNLGKGDITLTGENTTTGELLTGTAGGGFILDVLKDGDPTAAWAGSVLGDGVTFTLKEGNLTNGITEMGEGSGLVVDAQGVVDLGGTDISALSKEHNVDITVWGTGAGRTTDGSERHGQVTGIGGTDIWTSDTRVTLKFDAYNLAHPDDAMLNFKQEGGTLHVTQGSGNGGDGQPQKGLILDFSTETFVDLLKEAMRTGGENRVDLHIVNGELDLSSVTDPENLLRLLTEGSTGYGSFLYELGFTLNTDKAMEGYLSLSGTSTDVYLVLGEEGEYGSRPHDVTVGDYIGDFMEQCKAVVVDENATLTLRFTSTPRPGAEGVPAAPDTDVTLHNLVGLKGSVLDVQDNRLGDTSGRLTVTFDNSVQDVKNGDGLGGAGDSHEHQPGMEDDPNGFGVKGQDTTFEGTITADDTVDFQKTGDGQLTIGGPVEHDEEGNVLPNGGIVAAGSDLKLLDGGITLQGNATKGGNVLHSLTFAYDETTDKVMGEDGNPVDAFDDNTGLTLTQGAGLTLNDIIEAGVDKDGNGGKGGDITLGLGSYLSFDNSNVEGKHGKTLTDTHFTSKDNPGGTLAVVGDSELTLSGASSLHNVSLWVTDNAQTTLDHIKMSGVGNVTVTANGNLTMDGATLDSIGYLYVEGDGAKLNMNDTTMTGYGPVVVKGRGEATLTGSNVTLTGTAEDPQGLVQVTENGKLTLNDSTLTGTGTGGMLVDDHGEVTLNSVSGLDKIGDVVVRGEGGRVTLNGGSHATGVGAVWVLENGKLTLNDKSTVTGTKVGDLYIEGTGQVTLNDESKMHDMHNVVVQGTGGELTLNGVSELTGDGMLYVAGSGMVTLNGGSTLKVESGAVYVGEFGKLTLNDSNLNAGGDLTVIDEAVVTMDGSEVTGIGNVKVGDALKEGETEADGTIAGGKLALDSTKFGANGALAVFANGEVTMDNVTTVTGITDVTVIDNGELKMDHGSTLSAIGALEVGGNGLVTLDNASVIDGVTGVTVVDSGKLTLDKESQIHVKAVGEGVGNLGVGGTGSVELRGKSVIDGLTNVLVTGEGKLSLDDSTVAATGYVVVNEQGTITLDKGATLTGGYAVSVADDGKLTLDAGSTLSGYGDLVVGGNGVLEVDGSHMLGKGVVSVSGNGNLTLRDGSELTAGGDLVVVDFGKVTLSNGSVMSGVANVTVGDVENAEGEQPGGEQPGGEQPGGGDAPAEAAEVAAEPAIEGGTLALDGAGTALHANGNLTVFAGGKVTLENGALMDGIQGVAVTDDGTLGLKTASTLKAGGDLTVIDKGTVELSGSTVSGIANVTVGDDDEVAAEGTSEGGKLSLNDSTLNAGGDLTVFADGDVTMDNKSTMNGIVNVGVTDDGKLSLDGGSILTGSGSLQVAKNGEVAVDGSTLTVGGPVGVADNGKLTVDGSTLLAVGDLTVIDNGEVALSGGSTVGDGRITNVIVGDDDEVATEGTVEGGKLTLDGSTLNANGNLTVFAGGDVTLDNKSVVNGVTGVVVTDEGTLALDDASELHAAVIGEGDQAVRGDLTVAGNGEVTLDNGSKLDGVGNVFVLDAADQGGKLTLDGGSTLTGSGYLAVAKSGEVALDGASTTLTVGDVVSVADNGKLTVNDGAKLVANGSMVVDGNGKVAVNKATVEGVHGLGVNGNGKVTMEDSTLTGDGTVALTGNGEVTLNNSHLMDGGIDNVALSDNSKLTLADGSTLGDITGQLALTGEGKLDIGTSAVKTAELIGDKGATLAGEGGTLTVTKAGTFSGTLGGTGTLDVQGGNVALTDVSLLPGSWNLGVTGGSLTLTDNVVDPGVMKFGDIAVSGSSNLAVRGAAKSNVEGDVHLSGTDNKFVVGLEAQETDVTLDLDFFGADGKALTESELNKQLKVEVDGPGSLHFNNHLYGSNEDGWHLVMDMKPVDLFTDGEKNVRSGGNLLVDADKPYSAAYLYVTSPEGSAGDLAGVLQALKDQIAVGPTPIHAERTAAAVAGSATAILSSAGVQDVHRQMESIRNRASFISTGEMKVNADPVCKPMHTWVNAESGYHKTDADGWDPGYTLDGWGGTIGIAREYSYRTTGGLALTAMYNDIKTDTADYAGGDFDTTYLSGFLTTKRGPWTHAFIATLGKADVSLDRTVNYGTGSYHVTGDTDGYSAGFMYEVSYTKMLNKKGTMSLEPLFNVEFRHTELDDYDEKGSDAGLHVGDLQADVVTFGLGTRFRAAVTHNAFGRASMFEARILGKVDTGDDNTTATNRLLHGTLSQEVEAAEVGQVGVELGAGITVPLRSRGGTIFVDASAEFRESYTNFNASAGYQYNF